MSPDESYSLLRLRVIADVDPAAIGRVVERFQNINVVPRRISAEFASNDRLHIEVDICGMSAAQLSLIAGKISQSPCIHQAYWHRLS